VLLLGACRTAPLPPTLPPAPPPPLPVQAPPQPVAAPAPSLASYVERVRTMPPEEVAAEVQRLSRQPGAWAQVQSALVLAWPQNPAREEARAQQVLDELLRLPDTPGEVRDAAVVLHLWLEELRRADGIQRRAQGKARDDELRIQQLDTRVRELERRAQDAEKKLEALRAIEREMSGRGQAPNGRF
jgi:hypothetical protein